MSKEYDEKVYRVIKKKGKHLVPSKKTDGTMSALQFDDNDNSMSGPVELEEVYLNDLQEAYNKGQFSPLTQYVLEEIVTPFVHQGLAIGAEYFEDWIQETVIPVAKKKINNVTNNIKLYIEVFEDIRKGKGLYAEQLLAEINMENRKSNKGISEIPMLENIKGKHTSKIENDESLKEIEKVQQLLELLKTSANTMAFCIRILSETIIKDDSNNPEVSMELRRELEQYTSESAIEQVKLMLEDKNRVLLDENTYMILSAFSQGMLISEGEKVPYSKYLTH